MMEALHALDAWTKPFFEVMGLWSLMTILYGGAGLFILSPVIISIWYWRRKKMEWVSRWGDSIKLEDQREDNKIKTKPRKWAFDLILIGCMWIEHSVTLFSLMIVVGIFSMLSLKQGSVAARSVMAGFAILLVLLRWMTVTGTILYK